MRFCVGAGVRVVFAAASLPAEVPARHARSIADRRLATGAGRPDERVRAGRSGTPLLATRELTKSFRGLTALKGHAISVWPGEIVGVIGPNGSGKSTFFNLVTGFQRPDGGAVELDGKAIHARPGSLHRPAGHRPHLPGQPAVHPALGAGEPAGGRPAAPSDQRRRGDPRQRPARAARRAPSTRRRPSFWR